MGKLIHSGDRFKITQISDDPDSYAVIHYEGGFAFPCGRSWFEKNHPEVGRYVVMGADSHWFVEQEETA